MHAIGICIVRSYAQPLGLFYAAIGVQIVAPPAWIGDVCVGGDESRQGKEEDNDGEEGARGERHEEVRGLD